MWTGKRFEICVQFTLFMQQCSIMLLGVELWSIHPSFGCAYNRHDDSMADLFFSTKRKGKADVWRRWCWWWRRWGWWWWRPTVYRALSIEFGTQHCCLDTLCSSVYVNKRKQCCWFRNPSYFTWNNRMSEFMDEAREDSDSFSVSRYTHTHTPPPPHGFLQSSSQGCRVNKRYTQCLFQQPLYS